MSDLAARLRALRGDAPRPQDGADARAVVHDRAGERERVDRTAAALGGRIMERPEGLLLTREERLPATARYGAAPLRSLEPLRSGDVEATRAEAVVPPGRTVYLDLETTGLSGGAGTYAFLIGAAFDEGDGVTVVQAFLPGPMHERAQLRFLAERLQEVDAVVSYNGASFDLPLLRTRFALHGLPFPLESVPHVDLLPWARRLWGRRLPDCTLGRVEAAVLAARRSAADVPGALVPERYRAWLQGGDPGRLRGVVDHNRDDVLALAALRTRIEAIVAAVRSGRGEGLAADERFGVARHLEARGESERALTAYLTVEDQLPEAAWRAAILLRRAGRTAASVERWRVLAAAGDPRAWIALAKDAEHRLHDVPAALAAVAEAERCGGARWDDLRHRKARLLRKESESGSERMEPPQPL